MSLSVSKWLIGIPALLVSLPLSADWPRWRGPNRDGVTQDFVVPTTWPATLKEVWKVTVGEGHSSPVTSEGRIYVLARQGERTRLCSALRRRRASSYGGRAILLPTP